MIEKEFSAFVVSKTDDGVFETNVVSKRIVDLPFGDVLIKVFYSSLNYKDALSASGNRGITKKYPHTPGIDSAGIVVHSQSSQFKEGDSVICMGYDLGMNTWGGFSQYIRVPSSWLHHCPASITLLKAMQIGTAGFTAAQCVDAISKYGHGPSKGPVLVTGATGGVGLISIMMLSQLGFTVHALTGKIDAEHLLSKMGAENIVSRDEALQGSEKLLLSEQWAGVIDTVGGQVLANAIKSTCVDGVVTSCGNAMSGDLPLTVYPFILRGVLLKGIYSANCPMEKRLDVWQKIASQYDLNSLDEICFQISLNELGSTIDTMLAGNIKGRKIINLQEDGKQC